MRKETIILVTLLVVAMFLSSACSSGEAIKSSKKVSERDSRSLISESPCMDSDGGNNPFEEGMVIYGNENYSDYCLNREYLQEYYCSPENILQRENVFCEQGCIAGVCLNFTTAIGIWPHLTILFNLGESVNLQGEHNIYTMTLERASDDIVDISVDDELHRGLMEDEISVINRVMFEVEDIDYENDEFEIKLYQEVFDQEHLVLWVGDNFINLTFNDETHSVEFLGFSDNHAVIQVDNQVESIEVRETELMYSWLVKLDALNIFAPINSTNANNNTYLNASVELSIWPNY